MSAAATRSAAAILPPARPETVGIVGAPGVSHEGAGISCPKAAKVPKICLSNLYMHVCILALTSIAADVEYRSTSVDVAGKTPPRHNAARSRSRILTRPEVGSKKSGLNHQGEQR